MKKKNKKRVKTTIKIVNFDKCNNPVCYNPVAQWICDAQRKRALERQEKSDDYINWKTDYNQIK